ncbi:MAG TPA: hypothetical protein VFS43_03015 [Polyangiaceae bacterium]|nr:hypothetical protein [Polyangiaceae bacterium]
MMRAKNPRRTLPALFPLALGGALYGGALVYGCADPHGDLDDFVERNDAAENSSTGGTGGGAGAGGAGGAGGGSPTRLADISGTFVFACTNFIFGDIESAIRFRATNTMSLTGAGGAGGATGGTLDIKIQALATTAKGAEEVLGNETGIDAPAEVNEAGEFVFRIAEAEVPGTANPSGNPLVLADLAWRAAIVSEDNFCARFSGRIAQPEGLGNIEYSNIKNSCVGVRAAGGVLPTLTQPQLEACKTLLANAPAP